MAQYFQIHPTHPQQRLIQKAVDILEDKGLIVYPTDSSYALGCLIGEKQPLERLQKLRRLDGKHLFTLMCRDVSEATHYANVNNWVFRTLKSYTPGSYTFLLPATREVPRRLLNPKRRVIGVRIPDNRITLALLETLDQPLMSSTLIMPGDDLPMSDPELMRERLEHLVDLIIDGGPVGIDLTTVVDLTGDTPVLIREGKGDPEPFRYD